MGSDDSISLEAAAGAAAGGAGTKSASCTLNVKILVALFVIFVVIQSEMFTRSVLGGFRGALDGRSTTTYGVAVQGIFLVLFYILAVYLFDGRIL